MTAISKFYPRAMYTAFRKEWSWNSGQIYAAILRHNYNYSDLDTYWSDISTHEISSYTNYTPNGKLLSPVSINGYSSNSWLNAWTANTTYSAGEIVRPPNASVNGHVYIAQVSGTSGSTMPAWPTTIGQTVSDGSVIWNTSGSYIVVLQCPDPSWTNITFSAAGYVAIYDRSGATDATRPLIGLVNLGGSQSITSGTFTVDAPTSGILVALTY